MTSTCQHTDDEVEDEGADGKARVGAEGIVDRTQVGRVREFKRGEKGWLEEGARAKQRRLGSSRWRCEYVYSVGRYLCVLIELGRWVGLPVVSYKNLTANAAHLDPLASTLSMEACLLKHSHTLES